MAARVPCTPRPSWWLSEHCGLVMRLFKDDDALSGLQGTVTEAEVQAEAEADVETDSDTQ